MKICVFLALILIIIPVAFASSQPQLMVFNSATIPSFVNAGDRDVILQFDVYHPGSRSFKDVSLKANFNDPFVSVKETSVIPFINPGEVFTVVMKLDVEDAYSGVYTVPVDIVYNDTGADSLVYITRNVYIPISNEAKIEISAINHENIFVGDDFLLNFEIENIGRIPVSAIQASVVMSNSSVITWIPSDKEINFIAPSSSETLSFKGFVSRRANHGSYPGIITLNYGGKVIENKFVLDLMGRPKIEIAGVNTDEEPNPGKKIMLSIQLENTGTGDAKSAKVVIMPGTTAVGVFDSYIGTIEFEDTGTAIFDITLLESGLNEIPVLISFLDEKGDKHEFETSVSVYNYPGPANKSYYIVIVFLAVAVFYFIKKSKQKRGKKL